MQKRHGVGYPVFGLRLRSDLLTNHLGFHQMKRGSRRGAKKREGGGRQRERKYQENARFLSLGSMVSGMRRDVTLG